MTMTLTQLYLAAWMVGGVLAGSSLLVGNFGRSSTERFTPTGAICSTALGLFAFGMTGVGARMLWAEPERLGMPWLAIGLGVLGAWLGLRLQRFAMAASASQGGATPGAHGSEQGAEEASVPSEPSH
jgi:hypothetical protein